MSNEARSAYEELLAKVFYEGEITDTRAHLASTGKNVGALSLFGAQSRYDLERGFPLVGTKKMSLWNITVELLWFLRGDTNVEYLHKHGVHIWDAWADENGNLGPIYGAQWRAFSGVDQIKLLQQGIERVKANPQDSCARRLIVSAWNPVDIPFMALPPCHTLMQFRVFKGQLSCSLYQRSGDVFLGIPYNIASYALLTHLLAKVHGLEVGELIHTVGDLHLYENHIEQAREQLSRWAPPFPQLYLANKARLEDFVPGDIEVVNYSPHPALKGEVAL